MVGILANIRDTDQPVKLAPLCFGTIVVVSLLRFYIRNKLYRFAVRPSISVCVLNGPGFAKTDFSPDFFSFFFFHFTNKSAYDDNVSHVMRKPDFAYAKTKAPISFKVSANLFSAFVFATLIVQFLFYL